MVFVKVRETYDLHTVQNKMTVIGVHTPGANIIKRNYPGLLMQCKAYRPVSCDVKMACASVLPLDPLGVGTGEGAVAPEDVFNPILYKAIGNFGMSQLEMYIHQTNTSWVSKGDSLDADTDGLTNDDFGVYYGLLSNTHEWKHANPQSGMQMTNLHPLVYSTYTTVGETGVTQTGTVSSSLFYGQNPGTGNGEAVAGLPSFKGDAKRMPFINTTVPVTTGDLTLSVVEAIAGFGNSFPHNYQVGVPAPKIYCGIIIVPPSRLHQMFYRLVCEWTLEFSTVRPLSEITSWSGLAAVGNAQHIQDYSYSNSKTFVSETDLVDTTEDSDIQKVM